MEWWQVTGRLLDREGMTRSDMTREVRPGRQIKNTIINKPLQTFSLFLYYRLNDNTVLYPHLLQTGWPKVNK